MQPISWSSIWVARCTTMQNFTIECTTMDGPTIQLALWNSFCALSTLWNNMSRKIPKMLPWFIVWQGEGEPGQLYPPFCSKLACSTHLRLLSTTLLRPVLRRVKECWLLRRSVLLVSQRLNSLINFLIQNILGYTNEILKNRVQLKRRKLVLDRICMTPCPTVPGEDG